MSNDLPNRQSIRLRDYDYTQNGYYFVTICTHNREHLFGKIENGKMVLNDAGKIVDHWWRQISNKFPDVKLDENQIMPNHLHCILVVGARSPRPRNPTPAEFEKPPTLGQIMAYFKYQSAKQIRIFQTDAKTHNAGGETNNAGGETPPLQKLVYIKKIWQRNFYERIIRSEKEYWAIKQYIRVNPQNWGKDIENV